MSQRKETIPLLLFFFLGIVILVIAGSWLWGLISKGSISEPNESPSRTNFITPTPSQGQKPLGKKVPLEKELIGSPGQIYSIAISADGQTLASGSNDGNIQLWNLRAEEPQSESLTKENRGGIASLAISPNGNILVSGGWGSSDIDIWEISTGKLRLSIENAHLYNIKSLSISPDEQTLVSGSGDGTIKLWNLETRTLLEKPFREKTFNTLTISPDGRTVASSSIDGTITVWNLNNPKATLPWDGDSSDVTSLIFSRDSEFLISGSNNGIIKLWNLETREVIGQLEGHSEAVVSLDISLDGQKLASGSRNGTVQVWELSSSQLLQTYNLSNYIDERIAVTFDVNGEILIYGYIFRTIKIWRIR